MSIRLPLFNHNSIFIFLYDAVILIIYLLLYEQIKFINYINCQSLISMIKILYRSITGDFFYCI